MLGISRKNLWEKLRGYGFTEAELTPAAVAAVSNGERK